MGYHNLSCRSKLARREPGHVGNGVIPGMHNHHQQGQEQPALQPAVQLAVQPPQDVAAGAN